MKTARRVGILALALCLVGGAVAGGVGGDDRSGGYDTAAEYALTAGGDEPAKGTILFEYYWGVDGTLGSLLGLPTFPDYPDDREWRMSFEGPTDWRNLYGTCVRGYLYPPGTGNYTFWIASDDQSELWLSKDEDPAHMLPIASVPGQTPPRDFDNTGGGFGGPQQKSAPVLLTAGQRYYIEALHADGTGGDNLAVAWQGPGIPERAIIAGQYLSPLIGPQGVTDPNLVGWWKLDETSGTTVTDSSGKGNNGTVNGTATWTQGYRDGALLFDGASTWVECGGNASLNATEGVTISAWIKISALGRDQKIAGNQDGLIGGYKFGVCNDKVEFEIRTSTGQAILNREVSGGTVLKADTWYYVAGVYCPGEYIRTYVNGQLDRELSTQAILHPSTGTFKLGREPFAGLFYWSGLLDDVRVYDRPLLPGEIRWLTGWFQGEYFANMTLSGSAALIRMDPQINFNWGDGEVFPGTKDNCSVRWTGEIEPAFTEPYTFYVNTDDGARLWLDDDLIIDAWWDQAPTEHASGPMQLVAGQRYHIRLEWYENTGSAACELRWSSPSTPKQVIQSGPQQLSGSSGGGSPSITLDPPNAPAGTTVTIKGSGFAANTAGTVTFAGTSYSVTTSETGTFSIAITVPSKPAGSYPVEAAIPAGGPVQAVASFTVTTSGATPRIFVEPSSGPAGTTITIRGYGFVIGTSGTVSLAGTSVSVTAHHYGEWDFDFVATLVVPTVPLGTYLVEADIPAGGPVEASANFTVTPGITLDPPSGWSTSDSYMRVKFCGFVPGTPGTLFFDTDGDGNLDPGEPRCDTFAPAAGVWIAGPRVPFVAGGDYQVRADFPAGGPIDASATFTVIPSPIETHPASGPVDTYVTLSGHGYPAGKVIGRAFFDTDRDGVEDVGERSVTLNTSPSGAITHEDLRVPHVAPGDYLVQIDVPSGGPIESHLFTVTQPFIIVSPPSGPMGAPIVVMGFGFIPGTQGSIFLDLNGNGQLNISEPTQSIYPGSDGSFQAVITPPYATMFPPGFKGYFSFVVRTLIRGDGGPNPIFAVFQMVP